MAYDTSNLASVVFFGNRIPNTITIYNTALLISAAYCSALAISDSICCHITIGNVAVQDSAAIVITYQKCCTCVVDFFRRCHCNAGVFDAKVFDSSGCAQFRKECLFGDGRAINVQISDYMAVSVKHSRVDWNRRPVFSQLGAAHAGQVNVSHQSGIDGSLTASYLLLEPH